MGFKILILVASIAIIAGFILIVWSFKIEPNLLEIKHYFIENKNLNGLRIVYAVDFHIAKHDKKRLEKIIETINAQNADLILLGVDFIKGHNDLRTMQSRLVHRRAEDETRAASCRNCGFRKR